MRFENVLNDNFGMIKKPLDDSDSLNDALIKID